MSSETLIQDFKKRTSERTEFHNRENLSLLNFCQIGPSFQRTQLNRRFFLKENISINQSLTENWNLEWRYPTVSFGAGVSKPLKIVIKLFGISRFRGKQHTEQTPCFFPKSKCQEAKICSLKQKRKKWSSSFIEVWVSHREVFKLFSIFENF